MVSDDIHLEIGLLAFEGLDQADLTRPFEVLARLPNSTTRIYAKTLDPVRDMQGLRLLPDATLAEAPQLDVLHVPGGYGQEAVMHDGTTLAWVQHQAANARYVLSVCTGALICGAAGLLKERRATTHWSALHLLPFSARSMNASWSTAAWFLPPASPPASTGRCGWRRSCVATMSPALYLQYAPEPPFDSGTPATAPPAVLDAARRSAAEITAQREATARLVARASASPCDPFGAPRR